MINFLVDDRIQEIIDNTVDKEKLIEVSNFIDDHFKKENIQLENYRWHALVNHISELIKRVKENGKLDELDPQMFADISESSKIFAKEVVDKVQPNLQEEEMFLLSIHFETIKAEA